MTGHFCKCQCTFQLASSRQDQNSNYMHNISIIFLALQVLDTLLTSLKVELFKNREYKVESFLRVFLRM